MKAKKPPTNPEHVKHDELGHYHGSCIDCRAVRRADRRGAVAYQVNALIDEIIDGTGLSFDHKYVDGIERNFRDPKICKSKTPALLELKRIGEWIAPLAIAAHRELEARHRASLKARIAKIMKSTPDAIAKRTLRAKTRRTLAIEAVAVIDLLCDYDLVVDGEINRDKFDLLRIDAASWLARSRRTPKLPS